MRTILAVLLVAALTGCSSLLFRVPIVQGNVVSDEDVSKLERGMTQPQVRYLLGTPLINSEFEQQRWDYVFFFRNSRGQERKSQLSLFFQNGKLARIEGDEDYKALLPENQEDIDPEEVESTESRPTVPTGQDTRPQS